MALDNSTADSLATAICAALNVTDAAAIAKWKLICENIYTNGSGIKDSIIVTLQTGTVITNGGPTPQTGPATPVTLSIG